MFAFFWKLFNKNEYNQEQVKTKPSSLLVNYVYKEYNGENTEEIEQLTDEFFAFHSVDQGGPMSLDEAKELGYPIPLNFNYEYPIYYVNDHTDFTRPLLATTNKEEVLSFLEEYEQSFNK